MALSRASLLLKAVSSLVAVEVEEYETGDRPERYYLITLRLLGLYRVEFL